MHKTDFRSLTVLACLLLSPLAMAATPPHTAGAAQPLMGGPQLAQGMMGPGMMGPGRMMGPGSWSGGPPVTGAPPSATAADALTRFVSRNGLACFGCHAPSSRSVGPSFDAIAHRYAGQPHAARRLVRSITHGVSARWAGYPPMPPGQATPAQADHLARLILGRAQ